MIRRIAGIVPSISSIFLLIMAVMVNSASLFYMSTAMIALILACRLQAYLSVRGLRFERVATHRATVGQRVDIALTVWSERRIKRPLVLIEDLLPSRLSLKDRTLPLPIAPCFDQPVRATYSFIPLKRGRYHWNKVRVNGTDALGLVSATKTFETEPAEVTVYPIAIPVDVPIAPSFGWGMGEIETGSQRGASLEPRGLRDYAPGDPMRIVHWKSVAKGGKLLVKEFESGSPQGASFFIQQSRNSDISPRISKPGVNEVSSLEAMCGHAKHLAETMLRLGSVILFPGLEPEARPQGPSTERMAEVDEILLDIQADQDEPISYAVRQHREQLGQGASLYLFMSVADPGLPGVLRDLPFTQKVCLIYDMEAYGGVPRPGRENAADAGYLAQLRAAGADVRLMPKVEAFL
ncbi:MAG TPA: DUF58 domain-containing protein [Fimbriimonadaceae bacterium]|nr:DUF58 domain-containing protein [Fimbriimonadaceae bacterium]HRJ34083.1 DUF58 domain-containing protein [Fimbriimonadaceae bacterium]